ncbi:class I SAM-dependent methyltransferase [Halobacterium salinarum]|uniref:BCDIN3 domain-containing RNA methyltransferase n=1 Tax=Halobacterium salinarum TaxID=2242 RepID=UPI002554658F|nr:class I SAM-dependent methyltransferase [Halobacterium salinarum]MDL0118519.1 class I SAM-dependent methyltransferase [Halobacterium salinarum]MDL0118732.1 class I SAM-dependent methyltransferase [Halobacterium salinarum]MDL0118756.1 class I SAM-dependent methyltransferase [Halobacterium salinarum]
MTGFNPREYWDQRIESVGGHRAIGRQNLPETANELRKIRLRSTLDEIYDEKEVEIHSADVLDAGCGNGVYSKYYADRGADVIGIDFSEAAIKSIRERGITGDFSVGSIDSLPQGSNTFDIVHCFSVLYHLVDDGNWADAISELARVLRPGGVLLLRIDWINEERDVAEHVRFRSKSKYRNLLQKAGIEVVETYPIYDEPRLAIVSARIPQLLSIDNFWSRNADQKLVFCRMDEE